MEEIMYRLYVLENVRRGQQDSPLYARRVSEALVGKTLTLDKLPRLGRKTPETPLQQRPAAA